MLSNSLIRFILASVLLSQVSACGFHLRGYSSPMSQHIPTTRLVFGTSPEDLAVKSALKRQFSQLSVSVKDNEITATTTAAEISQANANSATMQPSITVSNIRLQTYQLRGILTEIRMVMSADVSYVTPHNGQLITTKNNIQVQRSYQYDQATVATDNPQADQIKVWLYDNLAQRIADQYMALTLPRVTSLHETTPNY